jgi:hypothetical protein
MPSPITLVFDLAVPRRPGASDVGGNAKANAAGLPPPNPTTDLDATDWNQLGNLVVALAKTCPLLRLSVNQSGTTYSVGSFVSVSDNVVVGTFTLTRVTPGWVQITWPANTFPSAGANPSADVNGAVPGMISANPITNGVEVHIAGTSTTQASADLPFSICLW